MKNILVISGHPDLKRSFANSVIIKKIEKALPHAHIRRLDSLYVNNTINAQNEQEALVRADIIVLQFPFHWYSVPAILKQWIDDVLSFNFAYGPEGDKLKGKQCILSFTVGGKKISYNPLGYNHFTIEQMLCPLQQTIYLTGMAYQKPIYTYSMAYVPGIYNSQEFVEEQARAHAERLLETIKALQS